ncbi:MAG: hypothetical protein COU09_02995 [Candidatus Harrisonbacteria bacterium CG10_big_fil_rev_8_21_14_0_10_44_23]|uniref:Putative gluconeogenesis factor n=1 Tax=Candidatus Harrisonbacteria bacterium CG10_big_fil_rev_8_21_14_0_10_44_23 TaxID=1974585 RepID=A0A2H0UPL2_9BACT|nr:MAG: hypothetical protein COU09_02995 [Candidatus Harrisonbacteria bacterium CG10_big_fil_rev_8_21_14_0_10_44_23]
MNIFKNKKVVVLGGGTGSYMVLSHLKNHVDDISAIVNMVDDGGSTGILRDELGVLPPGDVRQCLVALSPETSQLRELFKYRFSEGGLRGHSFGNLFLTALEKLGNDFGAAVKTAGELLQIRGRVVPVTLDNVRLRLKTKNGGVIAGEGVIDKMVFAPKEKPSVFIEPKATINPEAKKAIKEADLIVIAPGSLHTSTLPALLVDGVVKAIKKSKAPVVYVVNMIATKGQTDGYNVHDFINEIEKHGKTNFIDTVVYNTIRPPKDILDLYASEDGHWIDINLNKLANSPYRIIGEAMLSESALKKGLIRHDGEIVARVITSLLRGDLRV